MESIFSIFGQKKVSTLQSDFFRKFGLTLRIYKGNSIADASQTIAQVREKKGKGKDIFIARNMKVDKVELKFKEEIGLKVAVAGSIDNYHCQGFLTLYAAQQEDGKNLEQKARWEVEGKGYDGIAKLVNDSFKRTRDIHKTMKETGMPFDLVYDMTGIKDHFDFQE